MFERFTDRARRAVVLAQEDARERGDHKIYTENLLAALFKVPDGLAFALLSGHGVDRASVDAEIVRMRRAVRSGLSDAEALATLGINLEEVRREMEDTFGPGALDRTRAATGRNRRRWGSGHIPCDRATKMALKFALSEAQLLGHNYLGTEHVLLGLLHVEAGAAHPVLAGHGVTLASMRAAVAELSRGSAAS